MSQLAIWHQTALNLEQAHRDRLTVVRAFLRELSAQRRGPVSADDARSWLERHPEWDTGDNRSWMGAVFREAGWKMVGYTQSETEGRHGSVIRQWVWTNDEAA